MLAVLVGKDDPQGQQRRRSQDRGKALAGKSTLNRLELTPAGSPHDERYHKIGYAPEAIDTLRADVLGAYGGRARTPVLDALAQRGWLFERCMASSMLTKCPPSRSQYCSATYRV